MVGDGHSLDSDADHRDPSRRRAPRVHGCPHVEHVNRNATGDLMNTDARLAVIKLNDCRTPRVPPDSVDAPPIRARGNKWQRFVRRQILSARSDIIRDNIYWRGYEGTRWLI